MTDEIDRQLADLNARAKNAIVESQILRGLTRNIRTNLATKRDRLWRERQDLRNQLAWLSDTKLRLVMSERRHLKRADAVLEK